MNKSREVNIEACNHGLDTLTSIETALLDKYQDAADIKDVLAGAFSFLCACSVARIGYSNTLEILAFMARSTLDQSEESSNTTH